MRKPRVIAYMPLHYGCEYLEYSLKAMYNHVEKIMIFYTENPSYGHGTDIPCPETEEDLKKIALQCDKVEWFKGRWGAEGEHRHEIFKYTKDYDVVITCDSDEVFGDDLPQAIEFVSKGLHKRYGVNGYVNFWHSFNHEVKDFFRPVRFHNLHGADTQGEVNCTIYHFSCAQRDEIMNYKYQIHGHKDELRPDYLNSIYYGWRNNNSMKLLHPSSLGVWGDAFPYNKNQMSELMKSHPNFNKNIIQ